MDKGLPYKLVMAIVNPPPDPPLSPLSLPSLLIEVGLGPSVRDGDSLMVGLEVGISLSVGVSLDEGVVLGAEVSIGDSVSIGVGSTRTSSLGAPVASGLPVIVV